MANSQLKLVADWERQKEQKLAQDFQIAQNYAQENKQKLSGLENYRLDYLRQAQVKAKQGIGSLTFNQHQQFIGKLDKACELQMQQVAQSALVADQRKSQWLQQQKKRKAVDLLIEKQNIAQQQREAKQEQIMLDELTLQKFIRNKA
ncbi:flagellar export protein FliJ [Paraglaciecola aquimarina]|uniref:Flagellar FliJ protein n=1 Tax=Paraglaciecola aquimarina TaxID=1235557 RepID=A0ABU3T0A3_9ALTE|nr:flagellar export protein FliJ [Paraglaciecola aquimarina]MDU0355691.1 flagellar export protein FliJ [Paraglaciecola aquimarina]